MRDGRLVLVLAVGWLGLTSSCDCGPGPATDVDAAAVGHPDAARLDAGSRPASDAAPFEDAAFGIDGALEGASEDAGRDAAGPGPDASPGEPDSGPADGDSGPGEPDSGRDVEQDAASAGPADASAPPGLDAGADAGAPSAADGGRNVVDIFVSNTCAMDVVPKSVTLAAGTQNYFTWRNRSADYPVDVWMSYGGGFTDLAPGASWVEPIAHCSVQSVHDEYADISTACSSYRFSIHCR